MATIATNNVPATLQVKVREKMNEFSDHMIGGACRDYADYTHMTGIIEGLAIAERELLDLVKEQDEDD